MRKHIISTVLLSLLIATALFFTACASHPVGLTSPRQLTEAEKEKVIAAALNTPEVKARLKQEPVNRTSLNWIAIVWNGSQASEWRILDYDWQKDSNFALTTPSSVFYAHMLFNFGEPPNWQIYVAVNPDTGKAFMVNENPYRTVPTPPAPTHPAPPGDELPGTPGAANDDIVTPPGGFTYRANVHTQGQPDWPPVLESETSLTSLSQVLSIRYRGYIETKAGQLRNNIIYLDARNAPEIADPLRVTYHPVGLPDGITIERDRQMYGGIGGQDKRSSRVVLIIKIAPDVRLGEYTFAINLEYDGNELGSIPCAMRILN